MNIKKILLSLIIVTTSSLFSQEVTLQEPTKNTLETPKLSVLDSIKRTFVTHEELASIDSLWMKELSNQQLSDEQFEDISKINLDETVAYDLPTDILKDRLKKLDAKSPFNIEYNQGLENMIKALLKNRKKSYERLYAISQYYFPMFEDALAKYNIPLEIKYLAIVESALNPKAKSRVGATGLWQFMYGTGIQYNLDVNSYIDERSDPIKATEAACKYLAGMYTLFGDWDLVLASYNCGPGNVTKAIRRSGGHKNYWNIRKNLPQETAGYVPAFLATMYIFEYHKEHGINEIKAPTNYFATDTILMKKEISFKQISKLIDIPVAELQFLNPSFKLDVIPYSEKKKNYLRLPKDKVAVFTSNEDKIYYFVQYEANLRERPFEGLALRDSLGIEKIVSRTKIIKIKKGDNIENIARHYGVTTTEIKKWNKLKSNVAPLGKKLKIVVTERIVTKNRKSNKGPKIEKTKQQIIVSDSTSVVASAETKVKPAEIVKEEKTITFKEVSKIHKIKKGENLSDIASKYNVASSAIKAWNKLKSNKLTAGKELKIVTKEQVVETVKKNVKANKAEKGTSLVDNTLKTVKDTGIQKEEKVLSNKEIAKLYKIKKGDNIESIAENFNVKAIDIKKWNHLNSSKLIVGKSILININEQNNGISKKKETVIDKSNIASTKDSKVKKIEKIDTTAKVATSLYIVQKGDNLHSISKKHNVSVSQLKEWNNLENENIQLGNKLIVAKVESDEITEKKENQLVEHIVEKGDNVWNISKKYGVTLAQLKEWNSLDDNSIQIGTKLIVSKTDEVTNTTDKATKNSRELADSKSKVKLYQVKKGDSLFSISKKYPGVSIQDLKKWNDLEENALKPGMKLKISG